MSNGCGKNTGRIPQVIGSVLDITFAKDHLPSIHNALTIQVPLIAGGLALAAGIEVIVVASRRP